MKKVPFSSVFYAHSKYFDWSINNIYCVQKQANCVVKCCVDIRDWAKRQKKLHTAFCYRGILTIVVECGSGL